MITEDRVLSNKVAQLNIYTRIIEDKSRPWGYVFEDDIALVGKSKENWVDKVEFSVEQDLIRNSTGMEFLHSDFLFLGICGPEMYGKDRYCGFCSHAYGISQEGARKLLEFAKIFPGRHMTFDGVVKEWCISLGGFPVSHVELESNQFSDHKGTFMQDREMFQSLMDPYRYRQNNEAS
jgi:GR25 family glycosyltransferase involved in LPS biosynthesis